MSIKQLQNDFTTPEQSKRLLELGVPAGSANCYLSEGFDLPSTIPHRMAASGKFFDNFNHFTPCWTSGRLIEILMICNTYIAPKEFKIDLNSMKPSLIDNVVSKIEELNGYDMLDFSKLEE